MLDSEDGMGFLRIFWNLIRNPFVRKSGYIRNHRVMKNAPRGFKNLTSKINTKRSNLEFWYRSHCMCKLDLHRRPCILPMQLTEYLLDSEDVMNSMSGTPLSLELLNMPENWPFHTGKCIEKKHYFFMENVEFEMSAVCHDKHNTACN